MKTTERTVATERDSLESLRIVATIAPGATPALLARRECAVVATDRVEVTDHREAHNGSRGRTWFLAVTGTAAAGLGGAVIVDGATNVHANNDTASRTYNSLGPGRAVATGSVIAGAGILLAGFALVDVIRAQRTEQLVTYESRRRPAPVASCQGKPVDGGNVEGEFEGGDVMGRRIPLGSTDGSGRLTLDVEKLDAPTPECSLDTEPFGAMLRVFVDGTLAGEVSLQPAYRLWASTRAQRDRALIDAAEQQLASCRSGGTCDDVKRLVDGAVCASYSRAKVNSALDDGAWSQVNARGCEKGEEEACGGVRAYLAAIPSGSHVEDARRALSTAEFRAAKLSCMRKQAPDFGPMFRWRGAQVDGSAGAMEGDHTMAKCVAPFVAVHWSATRASCSKTPERCDVSPYSEFVEAAAPWLKDAKARQAAARALQSTADQRAKDARTPKPSRPKCTACTAAYEKRQDACYFVEGTCRNDRKKTPADCETAEDKCHKAAEQRRTQCNSSCDQ